jgi:hypothetical protein
MAIAMMMVMMRRSVYPGRSGFTSPQYVVAVVRLLG